MYHLIFPLEMHESSNFFISSQYLLFSLKKNYSVLYALLRLPITNVEIGLAFVVPIMIARCPLVIVIVNFEK